VGSIIVATGYDPFDPHLLPQYGYGVHDHIITGLQFERLSSPSGPTRGEILLKDGSVPKAIAFLHCIGSRDENAKLYCSRVCCMASMKQAHLAKEKTGAEIYEFYIDINAFGKDIRSSIKEFEKREFTLSEGKALKIYKKDGRLIVEAEDTLLGTPIEIPVDLVVLGAGITARRDAERVARYWGSARAQTDFYGGPSKAETRGYKCRWDFLGRVLPGPQRYSRHSRPGLCRCSRGDVLGHQG